MKLYTYISTDLFVDHGRAGDSQPHAELEGREVNVMLEQAVQECQYDNAAGVIVGGTSRRRRARLEVLD